MKNLSKFLPKNLLLDSIWLTVDDGLITRNKCQGVTILAKNRHSSRERLKSFEKSAINMTHSILRVEFDSEYKY